MKKAILLILIAILTSGVSFGQFALGVKLGYNGNKLTTDLDSVKSQFKSGFHIGAWTRFGKRLYLAPELQYAFSGGVFTEQVGDIATGWKQKVTIGSLDIPVLVGFKIIHSKFITWRIELGPQASFIVNKKIEDVNTVLGPIEEADLNTATWYILGGTGIDILFLKFDIRYQYGLNKLIEDAGGYQFDTKNQMVVISLGFKIFGKK
jgi:hypothetical protein